MISPGSGASVKKLLFDRSTEDRYGDPGLPIMEANEYGRLSLLLADDNESLYLSGRGASPEGDRPFLDKLTLSNLSTQRLWQSEAPYYSSFVTFLDNDSKRISHQPG